MVDFFWEWCEDSCRLHFASEYLFRKTTGLRVRQHTGTHSCHGHHVTISPEFRNRPISLFIIYCALMNPKRHSLWTCQSEGLTFVLKSTSTAHRDWWPAILFLSRLLCDSSFPFEISEVSFCDSDSWQRFFIILGFLAATRIFGNGVSGS